VLVTYYNTEGEAEILGSRPDYTGALAAGEEIVLPGTLAPRVVRVESIDSATSTAQIRVWSLPATGARTVRIASILFNPDGPDWIGEYVTIRNDTATSVDLGGWSLADRAGHAYAVPGGTSLEPGHELRIWTGPGTNSTTDLFMGRRAAIWNNTGDTASLSNPVGAIIATYAYGDGG
jgi:Lamin Tail Domain